MVELAIERNKPDYGRIPASGQGREVEFSWGAGEGPTFWSSSDLLAEGSNIGLDADVWTCPVSYGVEAV